jgi:hypothetical protein
MLQEGCSSYLILFKLRPRYDYHDSNLDLGGETRVLNFSAELCLYSTLDQRYLNFEKDSSIIFEWYVLKNRRG